MERIKGEVAQRLVAFARDRYGVELEPPVFLYPPSPDLGDLALATAFDLGKRLRQNPRALAAEVSTALSGIPVPRVIAPSPFRPRTWRRRKSP